MKKRKQTDQRKMGQKNTFAYVRWTLRFLSKNCPLYVFYRAILSLFGSAVGLLDLYMIRFAVNAIHSGAGFIFASRYLIVLITSYVLYSVSYELISAKANPYFEYVLKSSIKKIIYKKTVECDYASYEDPGFYEQYILAAAGASGTLEEVLYTSIDLFDKFIELLFAGSLALIIDKFTILFAFLPFILVPIYSKSSKLRHQMKKEVNSEKRRADYVRSAFFRRDYAKEIRMTKISRPLIDLYYTSIGSLKRIYSKTGRKRAIISVVESILKSVLSQHIILGYIAYRVLISHTMLFGDCIVLVSVVETVFFSIDQLLVDFKDLHTSSLSVKEIVSFLENKPKIISGSNFDVENGDIEFSNVSFKYSGMEEYALQDISLNIKKGERIAIVGENGAGKSTLLKLLLRLYDPTEGEITLRGSDIKNYSLSSYRNLFATVFQDFHLFSFSIKENIQMGEESKPEAVNQSIENTHFDSVVNSLPKKENTTVGKEYDDNGVVFSGGQRQQLAITTAYHKNAKIFLFDEPSSALDPEAETKMYNDLFNISHDKTVVFISHRLSSARFADKILFLKEGNLIEQGSFAELMNINGEFATLFKMQASNYSK